MDILRFNKQVFRNEKPVLLLSTSQGPRGDATNIQILTQLMLLWGADIKGSFELGNFYDYFVDEKLNTEKDQELTNSVTAFINTL